MADEKAARRNADNAGGILGSLRDALKAAGRGDVAFDDPTDRKAAERKAGERKTPAVIALAPFRR